MEINNNNSLYLHETFEDKGDKSDMRMQCENKISQSVTTVKSGFSREKLVASSLKEIIEIRTMSVEITDDKEVSVALSSDSDESFQSDFDGMSTLKVTPSIPDYESSQVSVEIAETADKEVNKIARDEADNGKVIKTDSERLEVKCESKETFGITTSEAPMINETNEEMTQSKGESELFLFIFFLDNFGTDKFP